MTTSERKTVMDNSLGNKQNITMHVCNGGVNNPTPVSPAALVVGRIDIQTQVPLIVFEVVGRPATQGSKIEQVIRDRTGQPVIRNGRALTCVREDNPRLAQWRQEVAHAASQAYSGPLLIGAVRLSLSFFRPRPKTHFGTGRNAGKLSEGAPEYPIQTPDLFKLARAVEDALTGVIWVDDSQIVQYGRLEKCWGAFRVSVVVESLDGRTREEAA